MLIIVNRLVLQWFTFFFCLQQQQYRKTTSVNHSGHFVFVCLFATARCTKLVAAGVACLFFIFSHYWWREKVMSKVWNGLFTRFIGCCCFCCCCSWSRLAAVGLQSCSVRLPWWISWGLTWSLLEPTTVCVDCISFHGTYKQTSMNFDFILYWLHWWTEWVMFAVLI